MDNTKNFNQNLKNNIAPNNNISNRNENSNNENSYNWINIGILVSMGLKCIGLFPLVIKVAEKKTAEEISIVTPIFFFIAFSIIFIISIFKKFYLPAVLFFIGMTGSAILFAQKLIYDLSDDSNSTYKSNSNQKYMEEVKKYNTNINNYQSFSKTNMSDS